MAKRHQDAKDGRVVTDATARRRPSTTVAGFFSEASVSISGNVQLREPQIKAFEAAVEHFAGGNGPAIIQLPVGCGKTGLAAILPFGLSNGRVLVVAPNTMIRKGLYADLNISNASCFWKQTRVLGDYSAGPYTALVDGPKANVADCTDSHIVVANIQQLASRTDRWLSQFPSDFFDLVVIDEGHHVAAESWQKVVRAFPNAKFVSLTATPFRADNKELLGELVYRYPFARAMLNGYIKHITSASAHPEEITFTARGESEIYTLEQIMGLKEEAWFRKGVALSEECNRHIAEKALEKLQLLRSATVFPHQIAASAMSIDHADQIRAIFEEMGLQASAIHSKMPDDRKDAIVAKLRNNQLDCIVQVAMLGEGFDHRPLSVAAIFRPYRSLSPYIQFVGRVMRTIEPNDPSSPNNQGFVVSHVGLNNEEQWDDFRDLDTDDQLLVRGWIRGDGGGANGQSPSDDGEQRSHRFDDPVAKDEKLSHFLNRPFPRRRRRPSYRGDAGREGTWRIHVPRVRHHSRPTPSATGRTRGAQRSARRGDPCAAPSAPPDASLTTRHPLQVDPPAHPHRPWARARRLRHFAGRDARTRQQRRCALRNPQQRDQQIRQRGTGQPAELDCRPSASRVRRARRDRRPSSSNP